MDTFLTFFKNTHSSAIGNLDDESEPESIDEEALVITPPTKDDDVCAGPGTKEAAKECSKNLELSKTQKQKKGEAMAAKENTPANGSTKLQQTKIHGFKSKSGASLKRRKETGRVRKGDRKGTRVRKETEKGPVFAKEMKRDPCPQGD